MDGERFSVTEESLREALALLAEERLTAKQKSILLFLSKREGYTATALVRSLSAELSCSPPPSGTICARSGGLAFWRQGAASR